MQLPRAAARWVKCRWGVTLGLEGCGLVRDTRWCTGQPHVMYEKMHAVWSGVQQGRALGPLLEVAVWVLGFAQTRTGTGNGGGGADQAGRVSGGRGIEELGNLGAAHGVRHARPASLAGLWGCCGAIWDMGPRGGPAPLCGLVPRGRAHKEGMHHGTQSAYARCASSGAVYALHCCCTISGTARAMPNAKVRHLTASSRANSHLVSVQHWDRVLAFLCTDADTPTRILAAFKQRGEERLLRLVKVLAGGGAGGWGRWEGGGNKVVVKRLRCTAVDEGVRLSHAAAGQGAGGLKVNVSPNACNHRHFRRIPRLHAGCLRLGNSSQSSWQAFSFKQFP